MIVEVELLESGAPVEIRPVKLPGNEQDYKDVATPELLEQVFYWGQNEVQSRPKRSVSVGDVARVRGERWRCEPLGWKKIE